MRCGTQPAVREMSVTRARAVVAVLRAPGWGAWSAPRSWCGQGAAGRAGDECCARPCVRGGGACVVV